MRTPPGRRGRRAYQIFSVAFSSPFQFVGTENAPVDALGAVQEANGRRDPAGQGRQREERGRAPGGGDGA